MLRFEFCMFMPCISNPSRTGIRRPPSCCARATEMARRSRSASGFSRDVRGMIVEDQLDCGAGRVSGVEKLEEFDELSAAMAVFNEGMDLAGEQINSSQQTEGAMAF